MLKVLCNKNDTNMVQRADFVIRSSRTGLTTYGSLPKMARNKISLIRFTLLRRACKRVVPKVISNFFFASELGTADEAECGGRWNQLLCYP